MNTRPGLSLCALALTAGVVILGSCSKNDLGVQPSLSIARLAAPDSGGNPPPHPTPPPDTIFIPPVEFVSSDSTLAGTTGISRWLVTNNSERPFTMHWVLSEFQGWPGFPIQGTVFLPPDKTKTLEVPVPVPSSAFTGIYAILLSGDSPDNVTYSAQGAIRVYGNDPPPPPPPPPPAVVFLGADSMVVGGTGNTFWELNNESDHPFTMSWALFGVPDWTGFPRNGSVDLAARERRTIAVEIVVPDSAATGPKWVELQVTRPDGLPPASTSGIFYVFPSSGSMRNRAAVTRWFPR